MRSRRGTGAIASGLAGFLFLATTGAGRARAQEPTAAEPGALPPGTDDVKARASATGQVEDIVELHNGGFVRGELVELDPGHFISIRMPGGELRRIPIADVKRAMHGAKTIDLAPPPPPPVTAADAERTVDLPGASNRASELRSILEAIPGQRVRLRLITNRPSILERKLGADPGDDTVAYHIVCALPCEVRIPREDKAPYRVGGYRARATEWFTLPATDSDMDVHLVSNTWAMWPPATLIGGLVFGALGGGLLLANHEDVGGHWTKYPGFGLAGLGAGLLVSSAVLWLFEPKSRIQTHAR